MPVGLSTWWYVGWGIGLAVIVVAALLLLAIVALATRITRQGDAIVAALDGTTENTAPLYDVARTNLALDRVTRDLTGLRTGERE